MLNINKVLAGVGAALAEEFPGEPVYTNLTPVDYERPSFLVECGPITQSEDGGGLISFTLQVRVTCFVAVDDYHNSHVETLAERMCTVMGLFSGGYISIGDRNPHVDALRGEYQYDYSTVEATLWFCERWGEGEPYPLMAAVETRLEER